MLRTDGVGVPLMKLLLHICCAVCVAGLLERFKDEGIEITGYFYNPNIHPFQEFKKRMRAVEVLTEQGKITVHYEREYHLKEFLRQVVFKEDKRCEICYQTRLRKTAEFARNNGFEAFSSTLITSPEQKQNLIRTIGERVSKEVGIPFHYESLTNLYLKGKEIARKRSLYRQQYCGCVYSEYERYL